MTRKEILWRYLFAEYAFVCYELQGHQYTPVSEWVSDIQGELFEQLTPREKKLARWSGGKFAAYLTQRSVYVIWKQGE